MRKAIETNNQYADMERKDNKKPFKTLFGLTDMNNRKGNEENEIC